MKHWQVIDMRKELLTGKRAPSIAETVQVIDAYMALHEVSLRLERIVHRFIKESESSSVARCTEETT